MLLIDRNRVEVIAATPPSTNQKEETKVKFRFFIIPTSNIEPVTQELNSFCSQNRILSCNESFVTDGKNSFWAFSISYLDGGNSELPSTNQTSGKKRSVDYKEVLNATDFAMYAYLRELRKEEALKHGVPIYILFTNEQLAALVISKVTTKNQMLTISGVGQTRVEKYGEPFLKALNEFFTEDNKEARDEKNLH